LACLAFFRFTPDCVAKLKNEQPIKFHGAPAEAGIWQSNAL